MNIMPGPSLYPTLKKQFAHGVRWYDEPTVSVIVPVGDGHIALLDNALDSLYAQTYRNFQTIVVFDVRPEAWEEARKSNRLKYIANTWPDCVYTSTATDKRAREVTPKFDADLEGISVLDRLPAGERAGPGAARHGGSDRPARAATAGSGPRVRGCQQIRASAPPTHPSE